MEYNNIDMNAYVLYFKDSFIFSFIDFEFHCIQILYKLTTIRYQQIKLRCIRDIKKEIDNTR